MTHIQAQSLISEACDKANSAVCKLRGDPTYQQLSESYRLCLDAMELHMRAAKQLLEAKTAKRLEALSDDDEAKTVAARNMLPELELDDAPAVILGQGTSRTEWPKRNHQENNE